jgi:hypothetical protein
VLVEGGGRIRLAESGWPKIGRNLGQNAAARAAAGG